MLRPSPLLLAAITLTGCGADIFIPRQKISEDYTRAGQMAFLEIINKPQEEHLRFLSANLFYAEGDIGTLAIVTENISQVAQCDVSLGEARLFSGQRLQHIESYAYVDSKQYAFEGTGLRNGCILPGEKAEIGSYIFGKLQAPTAVSFDKLNYSSEEGAPKVDERVTASGLTFSRNRDFSFALTNQADAPLELSKYVRVLAYDKDGRLYEKTLVDVGNNVLQPDETRVLESNFLFDPLPETTYKVYPVYSDID